MSYLLSNEIMRKKRVDGKGRALKTVIFIENVFLRKLRDLNFVTEKLKENILEEKARFLKAKIFN